MTGDEVDNLNSSTLKNPTAILLDDIWNMRTVNLDDGKTALLDEKYNAEVKPTTTNKFASRL